MKKIAAVLLPLLLTFCLGFGAGYVFLRYQQERTAEIIAPQDTGRFDLQLPGEVEKRIVTKDEVEAKLVKIGQLATYSGEYTVSKSVEHSRYFLDDIPILGTTNTIRIECDGIVKVGYEVSSILPTVDNESQKIYIALPAPILLDNYVIWDSIKYSEVNSILNPIDFEQYQALIDEIEQEGLLQTERQGIYHSAEENVKLVIQNFLADFDGYEIVFL